jgi:hypothetical protein
MGDETRRARCVHVAARDHMHIARAPPNASQRKTSRPRYGTGRGSRQRTETSCSPSISEQVTGGTHSHRSLATTTNTPNDRERRLLSAHAALVCIIACDMSLVDVDRNHVQCDFTIGLA